MLANNDLFSPLFFHFHQLFLWPNSDAQRAIRNGVEVLVKVPVKVQVKTLVKVKVKV